MTDMREAVARALAKHDRIEICSDASYALSSYGPKADAALSLMQPEIDRRVAEEKAKLLERFDEDELEQIISNSLDMDWLPRDAARAIRQAMLAQYEKDDVARPEVFSRAIVHLQKELQKALDMARPELIVELVNALPTIISALQEKDL